jgi:maltodextrin utilization protein YvdJ
MYVYALKDVINNATLLPGISGTLMQNLFVIMYFLAIALLPIAILYKSIKGSGK